MSRRDAHRRGFALLTVLWIVAAAGTVALVAAMAAHGALDASRNRMAGARAEWLARGCAARVRGIIDSLVDSTHMHGNERQRVWQRLGPAVESLPAMASLGCVLRLEAAGTRLDVNAASESQLVRLLEQMSITADPKLLAASLFTWRGVESNAVLALADRDWYENNGRVGPRAGPLAADAELWLVRGFEDFTLFDTVLSAEPGRVSLMTAPYTVLASLPGFTREAAEHLIARREQPIAPMSLLEIINTLSPLAADSLSGHYSELARVTTMLPDAWIVAATARSGSPPIEATTELRLTLGSSAVVVSRYRSDP